MGSSKVNLLEINFLIATKASFERETDWVDYSPSVSTMPLPPSKSHAPIHELILLMSGRCAITPVLLTLGQSASARSTNANSFSSVMVACPGYTKSAQNWQVIHIITICGAAQYVTHLLRFPLKRKIPDPFSPHPPQFLPLWVIHYSLPLP